MKKQPLLVLCLFFILGIMAREYLLPNSAGIYAFAGALVLFACSLIKNYYILRYRAVALCALFSGLGMLLHNPASAPSGRIAGKHAIIFKITGKLNSNQKSRRYEVLIMQLDSGLQKDAKAVLSVPKEAPGLDFKHYYKTVAYLNTVKPPANNFTFNYQKYLGRRGIHLQGSAQGDIMESARDDLNFSEKIMQWRLEILQKLDTANWHPKTREFTKSIILADRTEMDAATVSDFGRSGLVHILAISGSHMAVIFWLVLFILKPFFPTRLRKVAIIISVASLWVFAAFIGYGSSVVRSCLMITTYYSYVLLQRRPDLLHALSLAALVILCCDTNQIFDAGFQLSFIAVAGIFWLNGPLLSLFPKRRGKVRTFVFKLLALSLSAQLATLPLVVLYFHQYSPVSLLANLLVMPLSEGVIIFSLLMTVLTGCTVHLRFLDLVYDFVVVKFLDIVHFFADFEGLMYRNIPMSTLEAALLLLSVFFLRFVLIRASPKFVLRFAASAVLFLAVRITLNIVYLRKKEVLVLQDFKEKILLVKENGTVFLWIPPDTDRASFLKRVVALYITDRRIRHYTILPLPKDAEGATINGNAVKIR